TGLSTTVGLLVGEGVSGGGLPVGTVITAILSASSVQVSQAAVAAASGVVLTFTTAVDDHSRNADTILGDNGDIYDIVGTGGVSSGHYLSFGYDSAAYENTAASPGLLETIIP